MYNRSFVSLGRYTPKYFILFVVMVVHNKGNYKQGEKTALRLGENNSKRSNRQRMNLKNIQAAPVAQLQKNK